MSETPTLDRIAAAFTEACNLSARYPTTALTTWLYRVTYPSGRTGFAIRFTTQPETEVDDLTLEALAGFRRGEQVWPDYTGGSR